MDLYPGALLERINRIREENTILKNKLRLYKGSTFKNFALQKGYANYIMNVSSFTLAIVTFVKCTI